MNKTIYFEFAKDIPYYPKTYISKDALLLLMNSPQTAYLSSPIIDYPDTLYRNTLTELNKDGYILTQSIIAKNLKTDKIYEITNKGKDYLNTHLNIIQ
ncbi:MAG: hypothetical protein IJZ29_00020 [Clostridia bacterium]|nr:hypothetical protein [Clostridia bacterium]